MALYEDGKPVSGLNSIPRLTLAQYNALNVKPEFWVRTDAPESYKKLSADQVSYDSNNTVKDKIDNLIKSTTYTATTAASGAVGLPEGISYLDVISIVITSRVNTHIFLRGGDNYALAFEFNGTTLIPLINTSITIKIFYV